ncbi:MAG TPA: Omp28-related outer membrane protein [Saprospiraceae bacterium]|nr:Omp28-related outer membrane protein [Saprospiraceae bacterium]
MKIISLLFCSLFLLQVLQAQTFFDDFESYNAGAKLGPQSPDWTTWSGADGGTDDVNVVTTDNHTPGGTKSLYFNSTSASGGPSDVILPFTGGSPLRTGQFSFTAWFKIPAGKWGYFNFQANKVPGQVWAMECYMRDDGSITFQNTESGLLLTGTFPHDEWFEFTIDANLNTAVWEPKINGSSLGKFTNDHSISSIDIFPLNATSTFWVDDVSYTVTPYVLPTVNAAANGITVENGLVGQNRTASVKVKNIGVNKITSFDLYVSQNGGTPDTLNISPVNIVSLASYTVTLSTPYTLDTGVNTFTAVVTNVNGAGVDGDPLDDTTATSILPVIPAPNKIIVLEEGTGTWCQWCPRGAVFMDLMADKYHGYVASIAVHNADPMTVDEYDSNIGFLAYPSAHVDRDGIDYDPSVIEGPFLNRVSVAPPVTIVNGAAYDSTTRELKVSLTTTLMEDIVGDYKIACVITEDSVRGTGSAYNQVNAYAGGGSGVMGGFELLPNPVPAAQMFYNHVARAINPSYDGFPYTTGGGADSGQVFNHVVTYTIPTEWDINQLHVIGLFFSPTGEISNASSTTLAEAVAQGFDSIPAIDITTRVNDIAQVDGPINLYPNPANEQAVVSLNLKADCHVQMALYTINGMLVGKRDYGRQSGGVFLPIDMNNLETGLYFINVIIDGNTTVLKLMKQ